MAKEEDAAGSWTKWSWERRARLRPTLWNSHATGNYSQRDWIWSLWHRPVLSQSFPPCVLQVAGPEWGRWTDRQRVASLLRRTASLQQVWGIFLRIDLACPLRSMRSPYFYSENVTQRRIHRSPVRWGGSGNWISGLNVCSCLSCQTSTITLLSRRETSPGAARTPTCSSSCTERKATPVRWCCWYQTITWGITLRRAVWISSPWRPLTLDRWQQE